MELELLVAGAVFVGWIALAINDWRLRRRTDAAPRAPTEPAWGSLKFSI